MDKFQSIRVEWLAADIAVVRIIEKITGKRMTDIAHMDTVSDESARYPASD